MHCETKKDPDGTWRESWKALEKAYAEGRVMCIGVSNFDVNLLEELLDIAAVKPHVVQNYAAPGSVDIDVRKWCRSMRSFISHMPVFAIYTIHHQRLLQYYKE